MQRQPGKPRILFVTSSLDLGGTERHLASISGILNQAAVPRRDEDVEATFDKGGKSMPALIRVRACGGL
jgi:hypothetical protein